MYNDPSQMREALAWSLFGPVASPRLGTRTRSSRSTTRYLGLFSCIEQVDKRFLREHFGKNDARQPLQGLLREHRVRHARAPLRSRRGRRRPPVPGRSTADATYRLKTQRGRPGREHLRRPGPVHPRDQRRRVRGRRPAVHDRRLPRRRRRRLQRPRVPAVGRREPAPRQLGQLLRHARQLLPVQLRTSGAPRTLHGLALLHVHPLGLRQLLRHRLLRHPVAVHRPRRLAEQHEGLLGPWAAGRDPTSRWYRTSSGIRTSASTTSTTSSTCSTRSSRPARSTPACGATDRDRCGRGSPRPPTSSPTRRAARRSPAASSRTTRSTGRRTSSSSSPTPRARWKASSTSSVCGSTARVSPARGTAGTYPKGASGATFSEMMEALPGAFVMRSAEIDAAERRTDTGLPVAAAPAAAGGQGRRPAPRAARPRLEASGVCVQGRAAARHLRQFPQDRPARRGPLARCHRKRAPPSRGWPRGGVRGHHLRPVVQPLLRAHRGRRAPPVARSWRWCRSTTTPGASSRAHGSTSRFPGPTRDSRALTCIRRGDETFLLGLCEGNRCRAGAAGRKPGGGRIQVFARGRSHWDHVATVRLPKWSRSRTTPASRYSGTGSRSSHRRPRRVAQHVRASTLDLGTRAPCTTSHATETAAPLLQRRGCFMVGGRPGRRVRPGQGGTQEARCREKEQSVHVFAIPASESAPASETEPAAVRVAIEVGGAERGLVPSAVKCWQKRRAESRSQFSRCWRCSNSGSTATTPCCDSPDSGSTKRASRLRSTPTPTGTWNERCASRRAMSGSRSFTSTATSTCSAPPTAAWWRHSQRASAAASPAWLCTTSRDGGQAG